MYIDSWLKSHCRGYQDDTFSSLVRTAKTFAVRATLHTGGCETCPDRRMNHIFTPFIAVLLLLVVLAAGTVVAADTDMMVLKGFPKRREAAIEQEPAVPIPLAVTLFPEGHLKI